MSGFQPGSTLGRPQFASIMPMKFIFCSDSRRPDLNAALRGMKRRRRWRSVNSGLIGHDTLRTAIAATQHRACASRVRMVRGASRC